MVRRGPCPSRRRRRISACHQSQDCQVNESHHSWQSVGWLLALENAVDVADYATRRPALYLDLVSYANLHPEVTRRVEPLAKAAQEALDQFTQGMSEEQKRWAELAVKGDISEPTEFDLREYLLLRQQP